MSATHAPEASGRGDQRRTALLESLQQHLQDGDFDSVNIADISRDAGVTRSAFYFYFENKATAVAALMADFYEEVRAVTHALIEEGSPRARIERTIRGLVATFRHHERLYRAMLDARATSSTVREMWDADRLSFVEPVAAMIRVARADGAPGGPDPRAVATVLLELNDRLLERLALGGDLGDDELVDVVVTLWLRTIYGQDA